MIETIQRNGRLIAVIDGGLVLKDLPSALDLIAAAAFESGAHRMAISKAAICEELFVLSSGLAGAVLEKFVQYRIKAAIFGDYTKYTSKPLRDFIRESNGGNSVFFTATREEAVEWLSGS